MSFSITLPLLGLAGGIFSVLLLVYLAKFVRYPVSIETPEKLYISHQNKD